MRVLKMDDSQCLVDSMPKRLQDVTDREANLPRLLRWALQAWDYSRKNVDLWYKKVLILYYQDI